MGLFDLLRGYAPIGPEHFALNPDNWAPPLSAPILPGLSPIWSDAASIVTSAPLSNGASDFPLIYGGVDPGHDIFPSQIAIARESQIGPGDFPFNPDKWTPFTGGSSLTSSRVNPDALPQQITAEDFRQLTDWPGSDAASGDQQATGVGKFGAPIDSSGTPSTQLAQTFLPPLVEFFLQKPPVIPLPPRGLTPLEELPSGSAGGAGARKLFPRSLNDKPDGTPCAFCGKPTTREPGPDQHNGDHNIPRSQDGNNDPTNYLDTCRTCNLRKGPRTPRQWYESLNGDWA